MISTSPIECLQQRLARKEGTNEFFILKILTIDDDPKTEKEARILMQARILMHTENSILALLKDMDGVIHGHEFFTDWAFEEKLSERVDRKPLVQIYTGRVLKRIILVLDCVYPHEFEPRSSAYINLQQYVVRYKLTEKELLGIFRKVVEVVEKLHDRNIIHRDLKLNNVVLNRVTSKVLITNFGLSKLLSSDSTLFYDQRGSPAYIAPEILSGKPYQGKPSDMWSLGVMLYTMIVGHFPFVDSSPQALFKKIKHAEFTFPPEKKISSETKGLIKSLLCLNPDERYSATETLTMLDMIIQKQLRNKRFVDQVVPDIDCNKKPKSKPGPSATLSSEPFSRTLEMLAAQTTEKNFIRPNILSVQRMRPQSAATSNAGGGAGDNSGPYNLTMQRRTSLTHQINNLSLRTQRINPDPSSWHTRITPTPNLALPSAIVLAHLPPPPSHSSTVQSLFSALNDLFTRGRLPAPRETREFNGYISHDISSKISTFLRIHCRSQELVRELFSVGGSERAKVIELFRRFGVQMEVSNHLVMIKTEQTINNLMFLTFMMQISGYNNNYFLNIRN